MSHSSLADQLRQRGIAATRPRLRIARVMLGSPRHLSAEQVRTEVNRRSPPVSKATVYNTLRIFTRQGLLREVNVDPSRVFYDSTVRPHHHFYNPATGELTDIPAERLSVTGLPATPPGTEAEAIEVIVRLRDRAAA